MKQLKEFWSSIPPIVQLLIWWVVIALALTLVVKAWKYFFKE